MKTIPVAFSVALLAAGNASAITFTYSDTASTTADWSTGTGWDATPVSASDTILTYSGDLAEGTTIGSNNDNIGNFLLNRINFNEVGTLVSPSPTITITGNPLEFTGSSAQIFYNATTVGASTNATNRPVLVIDNNIILSSPLTVYVNQSGPTPSVTLNGVISGDNSFTFSGLPGANGSLQITNPGNSYTGDTQLTLGATSGRTKILRLGADEVIPNGVGKGNLYFNSSSEAGTLYLEIFGHTETVNAINSGILPRSGGSFGQHVIRNGDSGEATLKFGDNDSTGAYIGLITDGGGALNLTKIGTGTQSFSGGSTHSGVTTIEEGAIVVDFSVYSSGTTANSDPADYFSTNSDVVLGADTTFGIVGRGNGATTSTSGVAVSPVQTFNLPNEVADQLVVGQELFFTKESGTGTPQASSFIVTMNRGATNTTVSVRNRMVANATSAVVTVDSIATISSTSQTLKSLTLGGAAATNATLDFGTSDNVTLIIASAPIQLSDGSTITLSNWSGSISGGGADQWIFIGNPSEFTSVFSQSEVIFDGFGAGYNILDLGGSYEVYAVPEPTVYALILSLGALGVAIRRRRR